MQFQRRRKDRKPEGHAMNNFFGTVGSPIKMSKFDVNMEKRERRPVREDASPSKAIVAAAARHRQRRSSLGRSPSPSPSPRHQIGRSPSPSPSPRRPNKPASPPSPALAAAPEPSVNPDAVTLDLKKKIIFHKEVQRQQRQMQANAQAHPEAQPKPPKNDILSLHDSSDDSEDNGEENVATVRQAGRERRRSTEFMGAANVEPVEQLKLDGARKAKIPHFLSAWFNNDDKKENKDPNASPALAPAPAPGLKSGLLDEALLQSNPKLSGMTTRGYSQNINYSDITLGRMIGEGAFGKVYEGKWRGKAVAVKVLVCQDLRTDILHEFQSEIEIMSVLRHPNICRLLGACMDPPHRALVVELMQRGSLWGVLRTHRKTLDMDMRTRFIYDTAKGMAYLHHFERPILHRDLKSPNLLVDKNYNIKLSDFGLARVKAHVQTMTGNCGTVQWMAPEVLGNQKYTEKADVFSFGIVIWEIMTGECPYDGMSQIQAALGVLNRNLRPNISRDCPPFFSRLMKACWNRQPELRPSFPHIVSAFRKYQSSLSESRGSAVGSSLAVSIGAH